MGQKQRISVLPCSGERGRSTFILREYNTLVQLFRVTHTSQHLEKMLKYFGKVFPFLGLRILPAFHNNGTGLTSEVSLFTSLMLIPGLIMNYSRVQGLSSFCFVSQTPLTIKHL